MRWYCQGDWRQYLDKLVKWWIAFFAACISLSLRLVGCFMTLVLSTSGSVMASDNCLISPALHVHQMDQFKKGTREEFKREAHNVNSADSEKLIHLELNQTKTKNGLAPASIACCHLCSLHLPQERKHYLGKGGGINRLQKSDEVESFFFGCLGWQWR